LILILQGSSFCESGWDDPYRVDSLEWTPPSGGGTALAPGFYENPLPVKSCFGSFHGIFSIAASHRAPQAVRSGEPLRSHSSIRASALA
jgi:hypothetical protein